jgi:hypothetical protein
MPRTPLDLTMVSAAGEAAVRRMEAHGLESWLDPCVGTIARRTSIASS